MQLVGLEECIELARTRSLSRAAENRCVTHPAFGRRIRALEEWVGTPLIERKQPLSLTPCGVLFLDAATQSLQLLTTVRAQFKGTTLSRDEPVRIATGRTLAENNLEVREEILTSSARLVANRVSYRIRSEEVDDLAHRLREAARKAAGES